MTEEAKTFGVQNVFGAEQIQSQVKQKQMTKQPQHHHAVTNMARLTIYVWSIASSFWEKPRASKCRVDFTGSKTKAQTYPARLY